MVIRGVKGVDKELPKVTQVCVRLFLNQQLGFDPEHVNRMLFTAVHRLPSGPDGKKYIMLRLSNLIDRDEILGAAMKLQSGSGYAVVPNLPPPLAERRYNLLKQRSEMSEENRKKYKLVYLKEAPFVDLVMKRN